jgi:D-sedoheptulose 7-phosphate isomerase
MMSERDKILEEVFSETVRLHQRVMEQDRQPILRAVETILSAFRHGGKLLVFGNGGSAADSQHFAAEMVGRFARERQALPAIALTTDTSVLTAISNDYQFDRVFARQIEALGRAGDVVLGISTSGGSRNVLAAFSAAKARGLTTIGLTGRDGGPVGAAADIHINAPTLVTARAQEVHCTILHAMCELIEREIGRQD